MLYSALINVMVKAARRAGRSLKRDLGAVTDAVSEWLSRFTVAQGIRT